MGLIGYAGEEAVSALSAALDDRDESVRVAAAKGLASLGIRAASAADALSAKRDDPSGRVRSEVARALVEIADTKAYHAVPNISEALAHKDPHVRWAAAMAIGKMGPAAVPAVPALAQLLGDDDGDVQDAARLALATIGRPAIPELEKLMSHPKEAIRLQAQAALYDIRGPLEE